jgi:hypothetical protein
MPTIIISPTAQLQQLDDFPDTVERTIEGSLHIRPGATYVLSDGEAAHLTSRGIKYSVVGKAKPAPLSEAPTDPAPAAETPLRTLPGIPASPFGGGQPEGAQGEDEEK